MIEKRMLLSHIKRLEILANKRKSSTFLTSESALKLQEGKYYNVKSLTHSQKVTEVEGSPRRTQDFCRRAFKKMSEAKGSVTKRNVQRKNTLRRS